MRILIITAQYYPSVTPNVYRWGAIAEHWAACGHEVHILCTRHIMTPPNGSIRGVWVHRAGHNSLLDWIHHLLGRRQGRGQVGSTGRAGKGRRWLEKVVDLTWRRIYWPDGRQLWYQPGTKRGRVLVEQYDIEAVISVGLPFTAHRIAQALKARFPDLYWLMDIEDPFSIAMSDARINNTFLYGKLNIAAEHRALQQADRVTVTVAAARKAYAVAFPQVAARIAVVPPVFNLPVKDAPGFVFEPDDAIHLAYFGSFYHRIRTPHALLALLEACRQQHPQLWQQLRIHFFGEIHSSFWPVFERYPDVNEQLRFHGLVSRSTVAAAIHSADCLINVGNRTSYHLPSKSVDYMMSGKPVVNICQTPQDTFREFMAHYPLLLNVLITSGTISTQQVTAFVEFLQQKAGQRLSDTQCRTMIQPYTLDRIAGRYLELLKGQTENSN